MKIVSRKFGRNDGKGSMRVGRSRFNHSRQRVLPVKLIKPSTIKLTPARLAATEIISSRLWMNEPYYMGPWFNYW
jgi:hypothetical protein